MIAKFRSLFVFLTSLAILILGLWFMATAVLDLNAASGLKRNGLQSVATVTQKWIVAGESRSKSHRIRYFFNAGEGEVTFDRAVPIPLHRVVNSGSTFQVTYNPEKPDLHEIFSGQLSGAARSQFFGGSFFIGFAAFVFLLGGGRDIFRRKRQDV